MENKIKDRINKFVEIFVEQHTEVSEIIPDVRHITFYRRIAIPMLTYASKGLGNTEDHPK